MIKNQKILAITDLTSMQNILVTGMFLVFLLLIFRNSGLYPIVFADEWTYSLLSRHTALTAVSIPSYVYLFIFGYTSYCGDGFLDCVRILNCVFFVSAMPLIYLVARQVSSKHTSVLIKILAVLGPINTYTAYFMPESMYFFSFWFFSWFVLIFREISSFNYGILAGFILGLMTMIKFHAIFLTPGLTLFIVYIHMRFGSSKWLKQTGIIVGCLVISASITRLLLGYLIAGKNGLNLFGSFYEPYASSVLSIDHYVHILSQAIVNLKGHLMALGILFGVPLASVFLLHKKSLAELKTNNNLVSIQVYTLSVITSLLIVVAIFTASVSGSGPYETISRLHMRYYNFAFPLFFIIAASQLSSGKQKGSFYSSLFLALLISFIIIYSMATLRENFIPSFVDNPELRGFTFNNRMFYCLGGLSVIAVLAWVFSRKLGAQLFVFLFLPLSVLASTYFVNKELRQRLLTDVYDQAGIFTHQYLRPEEHSNLAIIASDPAGLFRSLFYIDNPAASIVEIPTGAPLEPSIIPPGKEWVLLIGDHEPLSNVRYQISKTGFSLIKVDDGNLVDFKRSSWPGTITRTSGLSIAEGWGTWSNAKEITLEFTWPLPKEFDLHLKAHAFGPNIDRPFFMSIGRHKKSFRLSSSLQGVSLFFQTDGTEKIIRIEIPTPTSPMALGFSGDKRQLGIGLVELRIISTNKQVQKSE